MSDYKVPFVDFKQSFQDIKSEVMPEIERVLANGDLILRQDVEDFENNLAKYVGTKYAVGVANGTDALFLSLKALGISVGDEVITSGYTFWATVEAIINCGATPVLADIGDDLLIDPEDVASKITSKTKAILPVHIGGAVCDMDKIMEIAKRHNLFVIEDTAQALGANPKPCGDIQTYSLYPAKVLGCFGDGGAITTNDKDLADKIKLLRDHGRKTKHETVCVGYNSRLDNLQAAVLNVKLKHLPEIIKRRQEIASIYDKELKDIKGIYLPKSTTYQEYNLYVPEVRGELEHFLEEKGIEIILGDYTFPMEVPNKVLMANRSVIRLPIWPTLTNQQIDYVAKQIREFFKR